MQVRFFGTYDVRAHPRIEVLQEGFAALGDEVSECNVPLGLDTAERVRILQRPWLGVVLVLRVLGAWLRLALTARRLPRPDIVVVGYLGHLDVHLARRLHRGVPIVLDHLIALGDTALDRGAGRGRFVRTLDRIDAAAVRAADLIVVDTEGHRDHLPAAASPKAIVVPVGASERWFAAARDPERRDGPLRIVFFGLFTPLHGTPVIGDALSLLERSGVKASVTMVGDGQDRPECQRRAREAPHVTWIEWVDPEELPALVASHDVCLGIFGTGPKALRVVPNKVFQGAAAGCAVVTSDTLSQRSALGDAARYSPPGDAEALAEVLRGLADDREDVRRLRNLARARAAESFRAVSIAGPLRDRLAKLATGR